MAFWKHKAEVQVKKREDVKEYLLKSAVRDNGVVNIDERNNILTQNDKSYAIYKIEFINSNGIDIETDLENVNKVNEVLKALTHDFKIIDMNVKKDNLNENIKDMFQIMDNNNLTDKRFEKIAERIEVMNFYNEEKYITTFLFISIADVEIFERLATTVFNIERLDKKNSIEILQRLNNGM